MKQILKIAVITLCSAIIAGVYGIIHDQFTYTISPEYYTKFKFIQFGLAEDGATILYPRVLVAVTGWIATWWVGLIIGFILSFFTLTINEKVYKIAIKAIGIVLLVTFITGLAGLFTGYISKSTASVSSDWYIPGNVVNKIDFTAVGYMHTYSYIGGLLGLIVGIAYIQRCKINLIKK